MGFLTILVYFILSLLVGVFLVGAAWDPIVLNILASYFENALFSDHWLRMIIGSSGILVILVCFSYLQRILQHSRRGKSLTFESEQGKVSITLFAIEDMLKRILDARPEVSRVKVKVALKKKSIEVMTRGVLAAEVNLIEFTKEIQESVKAKMHTLLGEDKEVHVNLEIRKVAIGDKKGSSEEYEPEVPFRNYE
ncbi:MAG: alkaline shock response membrane anchor protein AmaP [Candidatus Omnitrophica bacterium]|nr:alkaline shock response membrane anchor protein AmaP [Candidatus Omnitrophota bacterium]MBU2044464.1 alkaline shock response membrane anchor protein AmaP [Candidatus Omnitrophota bacterium]MBU2474094.1 alkaline shock response membrane anchor protein AmaP [Candidatus Omnitrophota bacterium]